MQPTVIEVRGGVTRKFSKISHAWSRASPKPLRVYVYTLLLSDQGLVCQCSVQPSCRWYEVLQRKTDGAYPRTVLHLRSNLLPQQWEGFVNVNSKAITMMQLPISVNHHGSLYAGGVFYLKAGDEITLSIDSYPNKAAKIYMATYHSYFRAFLI